MCQSFSAVLQRFDSKLWGHHVLVPGDITEHFRSKNVSRLEATIDDKLTIHCALMPWKGGEYFININNEVRKKLRWRIGETRDMTLKADLSEYGMKMAEEFQELLAIDDEGRDVFHTLTPGKQRTLIYLASSPKQSSTRLKKSVIIIDYLKSVDGKLDFKELNQAFKDRKHDF
jgi:hypothetical protein